MGSHTYEDLVKHYGHTLACVKYGDVNVAIECEDCNEVLLDFTKED